jgi:hypothetical protein
VSERIESADLRVKTMSKTKVVLLKTVRGSKDPDINYCILTEKFADALDHYDPWKTLGAEIDSNNPGVKQSFLSSSKQARAWCKDNDCIVETVWEVVGY